jgi:hypothetical protein
LHCTENYNGYLTGNGGIHSRYETGMITAYQSLLTIYSDSARYIYSPLDYSFELILQSQALVESVLTADTYAKNVSGWSGSGTPPAEYYAALWDKTQNFTRERIQTATIAIASLWYSAWIDAQAVTNAVEADHLIPDGFSLEQNYPNPFNPTTNIRYQISDICHVTIKVYNMLGVEAATLVDRIEQPGYKSVQFNSTTVLGGLSSGVYYYRLEASNFIQNYSETKKLILLK